VKPLSIALLYGKAARIKLAWKGLPGTNAVAYYDNLEITDKKIYNDGPRDNYPF
jgi:hypothetical protein